MRFQNGARLVQRRELHAEALLVTSTARSGSAGARSAARRRLRPGRIQPVEQRGGDAACRSRRPPATGPGSPPNRHARGARAVSSPGAGRTIRRREGLLALPRAGCDPDVPTVCPPQLLVDHGRSRDLAPTLLPVQQRVARSRTATASDRREGTWLDEQGEKATRRRSRRDAMSHPRTCAGLATRRVQPRRRCGRRRPPPRCRRVGVRPRPAPTPRRRTGSRRAAHRPAPVTSAVTVSVPSPWRGSRDRSCSRSIRLPSGCAGTPRRPRPCRSCPSG